MAQLAGQVHNVVRPITSHHELMDVIGAIATSSSVTAVNLSHCKFSLDAASSLATSLVKSAQGHGSIHLVRLVSCGLDSKMMDALSAPGACDRLEVIEISENPLGDDSGPAIAKIIRQSCLTLKSLDLADCQITAGGIKCIAPTLAISPSPVLRSLVLTNNELRTPGIIHLCDALKNNSSIVDLDISGNCINCEAGDALAKLLVQNKNIQCLSCSANYLSSGAARILSVLANREVPLRLLDISDNHIDDETCKTAARLLNGAPMDVVCLSIQKNHISNEGVIALYHMLRRSVLQFLDASMLHITEGSSLVVSDLIRHCENLGSIQIDGNNLGDDAVVEILYAVAQSKSISSINLERTGLGARSADVIANSIAKTNRIRTLNIADNPIDTLAVLRILQAFSHSQQQQTTSSAGFNSSSNNANNSNNNNNRRDGPQSKLELLDLSNLSLPETENVQHALLELFQYNLMLKEITLDFCGVSATLPNRKLTRELVEKLNSAKRNPALLQEGGDNSMNSNNNNNNNQGNSSLAAALKSFGSVLPKIESISSAKLNATSERLQKLQERQQQQINGGVLLNQNKLRPHHRPAWAPVTAAHMRGGHQNQLQQRGYNNNNNSYGSGVGAGGGELVTTDGNNSNNTLGDEMDDEEAEDITHLPTEPNPNSLMHSLYPSFGYGRFSNAESVSSLSYPLPFNMAHGQLAHKAIWPPRGDGSHLFAQAPRRSAMKSLFSLDQLERNVGQLPVTDEQLRLKFSELDAEGVGTLPRDEFVQFYKSLQGFGIPPTDKEVNRVFSRYVNPGATRITYDQFCLIMLNFAAR